MYILKTFLLVSFLYLAAGEGGIPIGPVITNTTVDPPPIITTTKATTTSSTTTTTTTTTPKPTTTTSTTPKPTTTTTTTTPKPTTSTTVTPKPTPTTAKPTPPTPVNPIGKWVANYTNTNRTCLVLEAELDIDVHYKEGNATKTLSVKVPSTATPVGQCGPNVENLTLTFGIPSSVAFHFKKSNDSKRFDLESVIVLLNVTVPGENVTRLFPMAHYKEEFSTPVSNSYKCEKEQKFNLTAQALVKDYDGLLRISHFQVQAFRNASSTKFDEALDCASSETPDVVPIAVGCALAALVIIVLIAYLIGRRRSQARGYLSM